MPATAQPATAQPLTILAVFAHPDDEIGVGSTLACYSAAGVRTVLICATRGEAATIFCDGCATPENLGEVRTRELECACAHLGISELRWLDWPDGGVQSVPRAEAIGQVVAHIRQIRPHVILTHPEHGLYPHPDHLAVWEITRAAYDAAGEPERYPEAGPVWQAARLFTRAIPQSFFDAAPAFAQARVQLNGRLLPFHGTPDAEIDVVMHVAAWAERRMAAWDCHRSQHNPDGAFTLMPDEIRRAMAEAEHFVLAAAGAPLPDDESHDLLAGLPLDPAVAGLRPSRREADSEPDAPASAAFAAALAAELAVHRGLADLCRSYQPTISEPQLAAHLRRTAEVEQEIIYRLAHALRMAGEAAGAVAPDAAIIAEGARISDAPGKLAHLDQRMSAAAARCRAYASSSEGPERSFWSELAQLAAPADYHPPPAPSLKGRGLGGG